MVAWARNRIPVDPTRRFITPLGSDIRSPLCVPLNMNNRDAAPSQTDALYAWYDGALAMAWFRYARTLLNDAAAIAALSPTRANFDTFNADKTDVPADVSLWPLLNYGNWRQCRYVALIAEAIANGFNALNIPWYLHQRSRQMYWTYLSGMPNLSAPDRSDRLFGSGPNFTDGWYKPGGLGSDLAPNINDNSTGLIPKMARSLLQQFNTGWPAFISAENNFVITTGIGTTVTNFPPPGAARDALMGENITDAWYNKNSLKNQGFLMSHNSFFGRGAGGGSFDFQQFFCKTPLAMPMDCNIDLPGDGWIVEDERTRVNPSASTNPQLFTQPLSVPTHFSDDWRSFRMDGGTAAYGRQKLSMGPWHYMEYFKQWVDVLLSSSPEEMVLSAREMATYYNFNMINSNANVLSAVTNQFQESLRSDPALTAVASGAMAIGAALSGVTYGISAIVGAAIAGAATIYNATANESKITSGRDDLGRFKPIIEVPWLSGRPDLDAIENQPQNDVPNVPSLYAFKGSRLSASMNYSLADVFGAQPDVPVDQSIQPPQSSGSSLLLPALGVGIAAFVGYKVLSKRRK